MSFLTFIKSKTFFRHTALALATVLVLLWLVFWFLSSYTRHGETFPVPDFTGKMVGELDTFIQGKKVVYEIIDSVYDNKKPRGSIIKQDPEPAKQVKEGRKIYLYVVASVTPQVVMPKLMDKSLKQAITMLENRGLRFGKSIFKPDQCAGCVVGQLHKGKKIEPGAMIDRDSKIDLIIGKGLSDEEVMVPVLIGLTKEQVQDKLAELALNEGSVAYDSKDTLTSKVYKQIPAPGKNRMIRVGSSIDIFMTSDSGKIPVIPVDTAESKLPEVEKEEESDKEE